MTTPTPTQSRPDWMEALDKNRQNVSYVLMGLGGVLILVTVILVVKFGWVASASIIACALFGLTSLGLGLWFSNPTGAGLSGKDSARLLALILGGVLGLVLTLAAAWQTVRWWEYVSGGTEVWQGPEWWRIWLLACLFLAGLAILFLSLLLGRDEQQDNPVLRRLLYGYNAVLTGLLVLGVLVAVNVLAYLYLPVTSDWTTNNIYTLATKSESTLKNLQTTVKIYVMEQQRGGLLDSEMRDLMDNIHGVTNKVQAEYLVRDLNRTEIEKLKLRYKPDDDLGLIVVYGTDDNAPYKFISMRDVLPTDMDPRTGEPGPQQFLGEDKIMTAIRSMQEGQKPVIYFTQGNGELDLFGQLPGAPPDRRGQVLVDNLEKRGNYTVKGLLLAVEGGRAVTDARIVTAKTVPDDAAVVIVAGPTKPLPQATIDALRKYMRDIHKEKDPVDPSKTRERKGKLMVLADVVPDPETNRMASLNLEQLLGEYDVDVTNERVLRLPQNPQDPRPERVAVMPKPELKGSNPLATLFEGAGIYMNDVRVIRTRRAPAPEAEGPRYEAVELVVTVNAFAGGSFVIGETDLRPPQQVIKDYFTKHPEELEQKARVSLPVAVAVSDPGKFNPNDPHAMMGGGRTPGTPRVEVIGDATFVSNEGLIGRGRDEGGVSINYDFFASALAWLREKPSSMGIEPKKRGSYTMQANTDFTAMLLFPVSLMSLTVLGLGLGVWVVRRR